MSISTKRLERIEAAYLKALGDRYPEVALRPSVWRAEILPVILAAVPDASHEEIVGMFNRRARRFNKQWARIPEASTSVAGAKLARLAARTRIGRRHDDRFGVSFCPGPSCAKVLS
jgi:hypothetical protein